MRNLTQCAFATFALAMYSAVLSAQGTAPFVTSIQDVSARPGETVTATISLQGNASTYEILTYVGYDIRYFSATRLTPSGGAECFSFEPAGLANLRIFATTNSPGTPLTAAGCAVAFRVRANTPPGIYPVRSNNDVIVNPAAYCLPTSANCTVRNGSITVQAPAGSVPSNVTGGWFDPAQSGHGLFIEHLADNTIVASWYTFAPDGAQAWVIGTGPLNGNSVTMSTLRVVNGRFPPAFDPSAVTQMPFGQMTLRFDSCDSGLVTFSFPAPFGAGTMLLRRPELASGIACSLAPASTREKEAGSTRVVRAKATGPVAALTGSWANPAQLGHGFQMEVLTGDRLVVAWYVFAPTGEQLWLIGAGPITAQAATLAVVRPAGGRFIPDFDPARITTPSVGTLTVTALSCTSARVDYAFAPPLGNGSLQISRITSVRGVPCSP